MIFNCFKTKLSPQLFLFVDDEYKLNCFYNNDTLLTTRVRLKWRSKLSQLHEVMYFNTFSYFKIVSFTDFTTRVNTNKLWKNTLIIKKKVMSYQQSAFLGTKKSASSIWTLRLHIQWECVRTLEACKTHSLVYNDWFKHCYV